MMELTCYWKYNISHYFSVIYRWLVQERSIALIIFGALLSSIAYDLILFRSSPIAKLNGLFSCMRLITLAQMVLQIAGYFCDQCFFPPVPVNISLAAEWILLLGFAIILRYFIGKDIMFLPMKFLSDDRKEKSNAEKSDVQSEVAPKDRILNERLPELGKYMVHNLIISFFLILLVYFPSGRPDWFHLMFSIANYCNGRFCHVMLLRINEECIDYEKTVLKQRAITVDHNRTAYVQFILHEIRVPLTSIMLGLDLIRSSQLLPVEDAETIEMMRQAANFMKVTLNDVLSWQKIEQEGMKLNYSSFPTRFLIQTAGKECIRQL